MDYFYLPTFSQMRVDIKTHSFDPNFVLNEANELLGSYNLEMSLKRLSLLNCL